MVVRLVARLEVLQGRISGRYLDSAQQRHLEWHLDRAPELADVLERAALDDHVLDVSDLEPRPAAGELLRLVDAKH